jgi:hypothetical protein
MEEKTTLYTVEVATHIRATSAREAAQICSGLIIINDDTPSEYRVIDEQGVTEVVSI